MEVIVDVAREHLGETFGNKEAAEQNEAAEQYGAKNFKRKKEDLANMERDGLSERMAVIKRLIEGKESKGERTAMKTEYPPKKGWYKDGVWNIQALEALLKEGARIQKEKGWNSDSTRPDEVAAEPEGAERQGFKTINFLGNVLQIPLKDPDMMIGILDLIRNYIDAAGDFYAEDDREFNAITEFIEKYYADNDQVLEALKETMEFLDRTFPPRNGDGSSDQDATQTPTTSTAAKPVPTPTKAPATSGPSLTPSTPPATPSPPPTPTTLSPTAEAKADDAPEEASSRPNGFEVFREKYLKLHPKSKEYSDFRASLLELVKSGNSDGRRKDFPKWDKEIFDLLLKFDERLAILENMKDNRRRDFPQRIAELKRLAETPDDELSPEDKATQQKYYGWCEKADYLAFLKVLEGNKEVISEDAKDKRIAALERQIAAINKKLVDPEEMAKKEAAAKKAKEEKEIADALKVKELETELREELLEDIVEDCGDQKETVKKQLKALSEILAHSDSSNRRIEGIKRHVSQVMYEVLPKVLLNKKDEDWSKKKPKERLEDALESVKAIPILDIRASARRMAGVLLDTTDGSLGHMMNEYINEFNALTGKSSAVPIDAPNSPEPTPSTPENQTSKYNVLLQIPGIMTDPATFQNLKDLISGVESADPNSSTNFKRTQNVFGKNLDDILAIQNEQTRIQKIKELLNTAMARHFIGSFVALRKI